MIELDRVESSNSLVVIYNYRYITKCPPWNPSTMSVEKWYFGQSKLTNELTPWPSDRPLSDPPRRINVRKSFVCPLLLLETKMRGWAALFNYFHSVYPSYSIWIWDWWLETITQGTFRDWLGVLTMRIKPDLKQYILQTIQYIWLCSLLLGIIGAESRVALRIMSENDFTSSSQTSVYTSFIICVRLRGK